MMMETMTGPMRRVQAHTGRRREGRGLWAGGDAPVIITTIGS